MSRESRRDVPEVFGLSVMDLVCGLFGLLVVLFASTSAKDGEIGVADAPMRFIRAQAAAGEPLLIGLRLKLDGVFFQNWPNCVDSESVRWPSCNIGRSEVMTKSESVPQEIALVILRRGDAVPLGGGDYRIRVSTPDRDVECVLRATDFYRTTLDKCQ